MLMYGTLKKPQLVAKTGKVAPFCLSWPGSCNRFWPGKLPSGIRRRTVALNYLAGLPEVRAEIPTLARAPRRGFFVTPEPLNLIVPQSGRRVFNKPAKKAQHTMVVAPATARAAGLLAVERAVEDDRASEEQHS